MQFLPSPFQNSYADALTSDVMVFGSRAFWRSLSLDDHEGRALLMELACL